METNMHASKKKRVEKKGIPFFSLLFFIISPCLLLVIAVCFIMAQNFSYTVNSNRQSIYTEFSRMAVSCESKLTAISNLLTADQRENTSPQNDLETFSQAMKYYPYIKSLYVYQPGEELIYTKGNISSAGDFFSKKYVYNNYTYSYWKSFLFYRTEPYRILSPTNLRISERDMTVVPIVFRHSSAAYGKYYVIFNVDFNELFYDSMENTLAGNSEYFVYNRYTNEIFALSPDSAYINLFSEDFSNTLSTNENNYYLYKQNGKKYYISTFSPNQSLVGYVYFAVTPSKVIGNSILYPTVWISLLILLIALGIAVYMSLKSSNAIWFSIKQIGSAVAADEALWQNKSIIKTLETITAKSELAYKNSLSLLSHAQESYLIRLLNSTDLYLSEEERDVIEKSFHFRYQYFAVTVIQIAPTSIFYDEYSSKEYQAIKTGLYEIIKDIFSKDFQCYVLPSENDILTIILNMKTKNQKLITDKIQKIYQYLYTDREYVNLSMGVSEIHSNFHGLQKAYKEASSSFYKYNENTQVLTYPTYDRVVYSPEDENGLILALSSGEKDHVLDVLASIQEKNQNLSHQETKCLYNYILNTLLKVIQIRKLPYKTSYLDFEIIHDCLSKTLEYAYSEILSMIDFILANQKKEMKDDQNIDAIISYINQNFSDYNLSLSSLADQFSMNKSKISILLNSKLDQGFHSYVTALRIAKAKDLLVNTDENIDVISSQCGFSSRQTFFRIFKSSVGMTTTEYRNLHRRNEYRGP